MRAGTAAVLLFGLPVAAKTSVLPAVKFDDGFDQLFRLPSRGDLLTATNWWLSVSYKGIGGDGAARDLRVTLDGPQSEDGDRKRLAAASVALGSSPTDKLGTKKIDLLGNLLPGITAPKLAAATNGRCQLRAYVVPAGATKWPSRPPSSASSRRSRPSCPAWCSRAWCTSPS